MPNAHERGKNWMTEVLVQIIICGILARAIVNVIRHAKLMSIDILTMFYAKIMFAKLVLACEEETFNTTKILLDDKQ